MGKAKSTAKRLRGRPKVESPKVAVSLTLSEELLAELDEWAREQGEMARAAAIRQAIVKMVAKKDVA